MAEILQCGQAGLPFGCAQAARGSLKNCSYRTRPAQHLHIPEACAPGLSEGVWEAVTVLVVLPVVMEDSEPRWWAWVWA